MSYTVTEAQEPSTRAIEALIAHGKALAEPFDHPQGGRAVVVPNGYRVECMAPIERPLCRIHARPVFDEAHSFTSYVNVFKNANSRIFADSVMQTILAALDYHHADNTPQYCAHNAIYSLPHSEQWLAWARIDGQEVPQALFAEFIEENALDIYEPASATVLEIAKSLSIKSTVEFDSAVNIANGTTQLRWSEKQDGKGRGDIEVPQKIKFGLPVFQGGDLVEVWAFLRTRIKDGRLSFIVKMHRSKLVQQEEFSRVVDLIGESTGIQPYFGKHNY